MDDALSRRFWAKVDKTAGPLGCWIWTRTRHERGYGLIRIDGVLRRATRLLMGALPGESVLHSCDNPPCVNPAHLRIGTHAENMAEMAARGRSRPGRQPMGDENHLTKIPDSVVVEIRKRAAGGATIEELADEIGCHKASVRRIITGRSRRNLGGPLMPMRGAA